MKKFRKIMAVLVAAVLMVAMMVPAMPVKAASNYIITINNALKGETYTAYRIFSLSDAAPDGNTYVLSTDTKFKDKTFYYKKYTTTDPTGKTVVEYKKEAVTVDSDLPNPNNEYYVLKKKVAYEIDSAWVNGWYADIAAWNNNNPAGKGLILTQVNGAGTLYSVTFEEDKFDPKEFADYLKGKLDASPTSYATSGTAFVDDTPTANGITSAVGTATIDVGSAGYFLVDTTLGSLVALDSTNDTATVYEKNEAPTVEKKISDKNSDYGTNPIAVNEGDWVYYEITVNDGKGTDSEIVVLDKLEPGLSLDPTSFKLTNGTSDISTDAYTIEICNTQKVTSAVASVTSPKTITTFNADATGAGFKIHLTKNYVSTMNPRGTTTDKVVITYKAMLNAKAEVWYTSDQQVNDNATWLTYASQETAKSVRSAKTYAFRLHKIDKSSGNGLPGVTFTLTKTVSGTTYYYGNATDDESSTPVIDTTGVWSSTTRTVQTDANGNIDFVGLDDGVYLLTETATVAGYNRIDDTIKVTIADGGASAETTKGGVDFSITTATGTKEGGNVVADYFVVENTPGTALPATGGMGTTVLYIVGGMLVILAGAYLFFSRKRTA